MTLTLTILVYHCDLCDSDTTYAVSRIKDIRKTIPYRCDYCKQ